MLLVDLNYNFECDWFVELSDNKLSDNKLSDNNLASELVGNRNFLKPITIEEIVIFMIKGVIWTVVMMIILCHSQSKNCFTSNFSEPEICCFSSSSHSLQATSLLDSTHKQKESWRERKAKRHRASF